MDINEVDALYNKAKKAKNIRDTLDILRNIKNKYDSNSKLARDCLLPEFMLRYDCFTASLPRDNDYINALIEQIINIAIEDKENELEEL